MKRSYNDVEERKSFKAGVNRLLLRLQEVAWASETEATLWVCL